MKKIILSAFSPFAGDEINPSEEFINWVAAKKDKLLKEKNIKISTIVLPVEFKTSFLKLQEFYQQNSADKILMLGLAKNREHLSVERIGINWIDARIADNKGERPLHQKIDESTPDGLFSTLDPVKMIEIAKKHNFQLKISSSAGEYVCNDLLYRVLLDLRQTNIEAGFIHIPGANQYDGLFEHLYLLISEL